MRETRKAKGVKKTGKLRRVDEGWGVKGDETCKNGKIWYMGALDTSRDTQKEQEWGDIRHFPWLSLTAYFTVQGMLKPGVI